MLSINWPITFLINRLVYKCWKICEMCLTEFLLHPLDWPSNSPKLYILLDKTKNKQILTNYKLQQEKKMVFYTKKDLNS